jgi:hypothetical protein
MNFDNNIRQKQGFSDMNIGKMLFCFRLQSKSCPKGAAHLLRECGVSARQERFPKSVKRFLDKKRGKQRNLEHHSDWVEMGYALIRHKPVKVLKLPTSFYSAQNSLPDCFARFAGRLLTFYPHKLTRITQRKLMSL